MVHYSLSTPLRPTSSKESYPMTSARRDGDGDRARARDGERARHNGHPGPWCFAKPLQALQCRCASPNLQQARAFVASWSMLCHPTSASSITQREPSFHEASLYLRHDTCNALAMGGVCYLTQLAGQHEMLPPQGLHITFERSRALAVP